MIYLSVKCQNVNITNTMKISIEPNENDALMPEHLNKFIKTFKDILDNMNILLKYYQPLLHVPLFLCHTQF